MRDENCIFCKIAAGEIPSATLYEDDDFRVILDIEPASKGHALILPKEHYANLYELDDEIAAKVQIGIAVEVLNSRLYRARQWIRKNYENEYREVVSWF